MINKMKKGLKLWMLAVALLATMTAVISTGKVEAENDTSNKVTVQIDAYNEWKTQCTWSSYTFNYESNFAEHTEVETWFVTCKFWNQTWSTVTLQLSWDLVHNTEASINIPKENVKLKNGSWNAIPTTLGTAPSNTTYQDLSTNPVTLFNKNIKLVWDASWTNLEIQVTIPAWQPGGTYEGTLVLTY